MNNIICLNGWEMGNVLNMTALTKEQKKKNSEIKDKMFKELDEYDKESNIDDKEIKLDSRQRNPIISKYKKQISEIINEKG